MPVRTTLAIDDDVLATAKAIAGRRQQPIGKVISDLARKGLARARERTDKRNGFPQLPRRGVVVTPEIVNALRDEEE